MKRCMNAQDMCLSYEAIRKEAGGNGENENPRLIVNPEYVESMDKSDGATQWDPETEQRILNEI